MKRLLFALVMIFVVCSRSFASTGAEVLYDRCYVTFFNSGKKVVREEMAVKIKTYKGVKDFGEIVIPFSTEHQKVKVLYAYTILPDGKKVKPSRKAFNVVSPPFRRGAPIYSDVKYQTISMPAVTPGATIKYAYEITTFKPYMPGEFWEENYFQDEYPVKEALFVAKIPSGRKFVFKQYNMDDVKPVVKKEGKFVVYTWKLKDVPPIDREPSMPSVEEFSRRVVISSIRSWDRVAMWYVKLAKGAFDPDKNIVDTVRRITAGVKEETEKIRAIYNFVCKNIRYVGMEFGINGYKPHKASEVFKNRYGDCKDHATLLISMLKVIGVEAYPVLIPTRSIADLDVDVPKPASFNHEIAAIQMNGKFLFLDTTGDVTPYGELPSQDQGRRVLLIKDGKAVITRTPVFPPESNIEGFEGKFSLKDDGSLTGNFTFIYTGVYAEIERHRFKRATSEEINRHIDELASSVSAGFNVDKFDLTDFNDLNKKVIRVAVTGEDKYFGIKTSHMMIFRVPSPTYARIVKLVAPQSRKFPFDVGYKMMKESFVTVTVPDDYDVYFIPETSWYKNSVGSVRAEWIRIGDRQLKFHFKMRLVMDTVPAELYPDLRKLFNVAVKMVQNQVIVLKRVR